MNSLNSLNRMTILPESSLAGLMTGRGSWIKASAVWQTGSVRLMRIW